MFILENIADKTLQLIENEETVIFDSSVKKDDEVQFLLSSKLHKGRVLLRSSKLNIF